MKYDIAKTLESNAPLHRHQFKVTFDNDQFATLVQNEYANVNKKIYWNEISFDVDHSLILFRYDFSDQHTLRTYIEHFLDWCGEQFPVQSTASKQLIRHVSEIDSISYERSVSMSTKDVIKTSGIEEIVIETYEDVSPIFNPFKYRRLKKRHGADFTKHRRVHIPTEKMYTNKLNEDTMRLTYI